MKKILTATLIMMGVMLFAQETKTAVLPTAEEVGLTQEQIEKILERDQERVKMIQDRVNATKTEEVKESPIVSQIVTVNEMFNHRTIECYVDDWVIVRLNARNGNRWELGEDQNGVLDLLMEYHNPEGKKPRIVNLDFDFDEDEAEIVTDTAVGSTTARPVFVGMNGGTIHRTDRPRSSILPGQAPGRRPAQGFAPERDEIYVFEFQAMKEGVEKITLKHIDTHMYIQMIGAPGPVQIPPFELTVKVLPNEKTNVTDTVRVKGKDKNNFEVVNREGKTIQVSVGDIIEITLQNKTSSGFEWMNNDDANAGVITRTDYRPGFGGNFVNTYKVEKAGTCMIDLTYMRPHEPNNFDLNRFYILKIEAKD
jgi:predicted secreted protein